VNSYQRFSPRLQLPSRASYQYSDVVRAEGMPEIAEDAPPSTKIPEYVEKYRNGIARIGFDPASYAEAYSIASGLRPRTGKSGSPSRRLRRHSQRFLYPSTSSSIFSP